MYAIATKWTQEVGIIIAVVGSIIGALLVAALVIASLPVVVPAAIYGTLIAVAIGSTIYVASHEKTHQFFCEIGKRISHTYAAVKTIPLSRINPLKLMAVIGMILAAVIIILGIAYPARAIQVITGAAFILGIGYMMYHSVRYGEHVRPAARHVHAINNDSVTAEVTPAKPAAPAAMFVGTSYDCRPSNGLYSCEFVTNDELPEVIDTPEYVTDETNAEIESDIIAIDESTLEVLTVRCGPVRRPLPFDAGFETDEFIAARLNRQWSQKTLSCWLDNRDLAPMTMDEFMGAILREMDTRAGAVIVSRSGDAWHVRRGKDLHVSPDRTSALRWASAIALDHGTYVRLD